MHIKFISGTSWILVIIAMVSPESIFHDGGEPYMPEYPAYFGNRIYIPADNPITKEGVLLGRLLFYEPHLSANNTLTCENCHQQARAFTDGRSFSPGIDGTLTSRNAMSLGNLLWVRELFWDGRALSLEEQAKIPLTNLHEMGQPLDASAGKLKKIPSYTPLFRAAFGSDSITGERIVKAIAQFERTLISDHSAYDRYLEGRYQPNPDEAAGMKLFMTDPQPARGIRGAGCGHCHGGPKLFLGLFHNNGLDSLPADPGRMAATGLEADRGRFRVPSLRNIALTGPYMHDGRFKNLDEVLDHYSGHIVYSSTLSPLLRHSSNTMNGQNLDLTGKEKKAILSFLRMLTDSTFISDPRYANPHPKPTV